MKSRCAAGALCYAAAIAAVVWPASPGAVAESAGTILNYDANGKVIDSTVITTGNDSQPGVPGDDAFAAVSGESRRDELPPPTDLLAATTQPAFLRSARNLGFAPVAQVSLPSLDLSIVRLQPPGAADLGDALTMLRAAFPDVLMDVNAMIQPAARGWDAAGTVGWPHSNLDCGRGLRIGMIDTPVDINHPAFSGRSIEHRSFIAADAIPATPDHGTAVAAILVGDPASDNFGGLVPGASLVAGSIFQRQANGSAVGNLYALLQALDWMASQDLDALNLSLETGSNEILEKAVEQVLADNLVITAAAGNGGAQATPAYPAALPGVIAVTAVDTGLEPYDFANHGDYIDFAAPGVELWTAVPGGGEIQSGTSFAVPFLTAMAAMQVSSGAPSDVQALRAALAANTRDLGAPGKDDVFGWGLVRFSPDCGG